MQVEFLSTYRAVSDYGVPVKRFGYRIRVSFDTKTETFLPIGNIDMTEEEKKEAQEAVLSFRAAEYQEFLKWKEANGL